MLIKDCILTRFFKNIFILLLCLQLLGGKYMLVQWFAWASMLVQYSQETSLAQAAADTFSGAKPCHLCKHIQKAQQAEPKNKSHPITVATLERLKYVYEVTPDASRGAVSLKGILKSCVLTPYSSVFHLQIKGSPSTPPPQYSFIFAIVC